VQDGGTGVDGIAEFRAQYSVKIKKSLDFSKDGKATFILHVIDAECYIRQLS